MAGNLEVTRQEVSWNALRILGNNCVVARSIGRPHEKYWKEKQRIGSTLQIERPIRSVGSDGQAFQPEGMVRTTVPLTVSFWSQESFVYNDTEEAMYLDMDNFIEKYVKPKIVSLANKVDRNFLLYMQQTCPNAVGTPGTTPQTPDTYNSAQTRLNQLLAKKTMRTVVYNSVYNQQMTKSTQTLFNPSADITRRFVEGSEGRYAGFEFYSDEQTPSFTVGTYAGAGQVNGAGQSGTALVTNNWTGASVSVNPGDRFTIANCHDVNPQGRSQGIYYDHLKMFVITAPTTDNAGAATFSIYPGIIPAGAYQNVDGAPANGSAITMQGASGSTCTTAFAFTDDAYSAVFIPLQQPKGSVEFAKTVTDPESKISMRYILQWDNRLGEMTGRIDCVYGICGQYADYEACAIYG